MKTECCRVKRPGEPLNEPKKIVQPFQDICAYFSEEEWAKLTKWQKSAYMYMKRNYVRMTGLGVTVNQPVFMRCKEQVKEPPAECDKANGPDRVKNVRVNAWTHRLRERKKRVIYEEISDPEEDEDDDDDDNDDDDDDDD
uniref:KRAB-related domain-containing protein n=1 Tax=Cricetulus griseus TaxID=10029 RepID=A0A8C2MWL3_CRIGR